MSEGKHNKSESRGQGDGGQWGNQKWPPFQKSDYHEDTGDAPDESDEYRKKMEAMAKRDDNYDPLDDLEGESERAQTRYHVDYHPRIKGEGGEGYSRRSAWERMVREKSEEFPRLSTKRVQNEDGTYTVENIHPDGSDETDAEWRTRVGIPSLEAYMKGEEEVSDRVWDNMTKQEKLNFIKENPRNKGESNEDWARRIGLLENSTRVEENPADALDAAASGGEGDAETEEDLDKKLIEHYIDNPDELEELCKKTNGGEVDPEELQYYKDHPDKIPQLVEKWRKMEGKDDDAETEDSAEDQEKLKHELLRKVGGDKGLTEWLDSVKNLTHDDLKNMSAEEIQALIDEYYSPQEEEEEEEEEEGEEEGEEEPGIHEVDDPLVAVNLNREKDARDAAKMLGKEMMGFNSAKVAKKFEKIPLVGKPLHFFYRLAFEGMFHEARVVHYEKKAYELIQEKQRGGDSSVTDKYWSKGAGLDQFVKACVTGMEKRLIHSEAGEKIDTYGIDTVEDEDGTKREVVKHYWVDDEGHRHEEETDPDSAEAKATRTLHDAIEKYAQDGDKRAFEDAVGTLKQELAQSGGDPDALMTDNYLAVAEAARDRAEHGKAMADVMAGFRFVNGEARADVRSQEHLTAVEKITKRLLRSPVGRVIPPEVLATAAGTAFNYSKMPLKMALVAGASAVVGATFAPAVVPLAATGFLAATFGAAREGVRYESDRSAQNAKMARGYTPPEESTLSSLGEGGGLKTRLSRRILRKQLRGENKLKETQYEMSDSRDLVSDINKALESGDASAIATAFAKADVAIKSTDRLGVNFISYGESEEDQGVVSQRRMELDIAVAEAEVRLRELGADGSLETKLADAITDAKDKLETDKTAKDKLSRKLKRHRKFAAAGMSAGISMAGQVIAQEGIAFARKDTVGLAETGVNKLSSKTLGHELTTNNADARNTLLAGLAGLKQVEGYTAVVHKNEELTEEQIKQYENDPRYTIVRGDDKVVRTETQVSTREALDGCQEGYRSNWLDNGTRGSDRNELRGYFDSQRGVYTHVSGESWGGGQSFNLDRLQASDAGFVASLGGKTIWLPATGSNGDFAPDLSGQPSWVADAINGRHFDNISFVVNNGVDASGAMDCSSVWTFGGDGQLPSTVTAITESVVHQYDVTEHMIREVARAQADMPLLVLTHPGQELFPLGSGRKSSGGPKGRDGRPGTHWEDDDGNRVNPPDEGAGEASHVYEGGGDNDAARDDAARRHGGHSPESSDSDEGAESPFDDSWGGASTEEEAEEAEDTEDDADDESTDDAEDNPAASGGESIDDDDLSVPVPYYGRPVRYDSENTRVYPSDDDIRDAAGKVGKNVSEEDITRLRDALFTWNMMGSDLRRKLLDGRGTVEHRTDDDYGGSTYAQINKNARDLLEEFGLVKSEEEVAAEEGNGEADEMDLAA